MTRESSLDIGRQYGLRRANFILDPLTDSDCFARVDIDTRSIAASLDTDLVTGLAPKRLVWGPYGGGKTHTLMRAMRELDELTPVHSVRVECPDLSRRSRFHDLYREGIMRALGQDFVVGLIDEARLSAGIARREEMLEKVKERFHDEEIAKGAIRLGDPNFEPLRLWRWISGVSLTRSDLDDLGQTQDLSQTEAARLADIIQLIGQLLYDLRDRRLVLILDEMERLRSIGPETITTFVSGFTRLVDPNQQDVSVLMGASAALESEMVEVFSPGSPVASRLTAESVIEIQAMDDPNVDRFIRTVIEYIRDPAADMDALMELASQTTAEEVNRKTFPFTTESIEALKSRLMSQMLPREITMQMTRALGRAFRRDALAVTQEAIV